MGIIVNGMNCRICGKPMGSGQDLILTPPFVSNELDPLFFFDDGAFHNDCFRNHPLAGQVDYELSEMKEKTAPTRRNCAVCHTSITDPDDYFTLGYLTNDVNHPLCAYNYKQLHRSHLVSWPELLTVYQQLKESQHSGCWRGKSLDYILLILKQALLQSNAPSEDIDQLPPSW